MIWQNQAVFPLLVVPASGGTPTGLFVYSGVPAAGNPPVMFAVAPGTTKDPFGNNLLTNNNTRAVFAAGVKGGGEIVISNQGIITFDNGVVVPALAELLPTSNSSVTLQSGQGVGADPIAFLTAWSKSDSSQGVAQVSIIGNAAFQNPATPALLDVGGSIGLLDRAFPAGAAGASQLLSNGGQPSAVYGSGYGGRVSTSKRADVSTVTVTQAVLTSLFNDTIKANDAGVGSVYEVGAFGFGTWGSTQQSLTFAARFGATDASAVGTQPQIAPAAFAASATFRWEVVVTLVCVTTGAAATWLPSIRGTVTQNANIILPGTAANNTVPFTGSTGTGGAVTLDSTVDEVLGISAAWASTTGAPTITKTAGYFRRVA